MSTRPTADDLAAARGGALPDLLAPALSAVFCGINPSLYSVAVGHHFARPGNRFWKALHLSGLTDRLLAPEEDVRLPEYGYGLTNLVARATAAAADLREEEYRGGAESLAGKLLRFGPRWVAILGVEAYRRAFRAPRAGVGRQPPIGGTEVWVLPNPSGLNAHYQAADLARLFGEFRRALGS